jgi:hypothetical protein
MEEEGQEKLPRPEKTQSSVLASVFSTNHRFNASVSSYSNKKSITSSEIHSRNLLNTGADQSFIDREQEK